MGILWGGLLVAAVAVLGGLWVLCAAMKWVHEWVWESGLDKETRRRLPPGDLGLPFIGNMMGFLWAYKYGHPDSFIASYVKRFGRIGVYKAYMFGSPTIFLTTPETCKQVLMDDENFVPGWPKATNELMGKRSFLFLFNEEHKRLRKLTAGPINGFDALSTYLTYIEATVVSTLDKWTEMGQIEFLTEMRRLTFRVIVHIFLSSESDVIIASLEKVYTDLNHGIRAMAINLPGFAYHKALKARKKLVQVLQTVLHERRSMRSKVTPSKGKDMMDNLVEAEDDNGNRLGDEEIIDILIMYLNAGHESSGHITMWATTFLQQYPDIFKKAKEEQEEIRRNFVPGQKGLTLRDVRKMEYLSKVIDETLRVVNISFVAFREATADVLVNGYVIPKGWKVELWYRTVHLDPEVHPNPMKFDPPRWNGLTPKAGTFLPFGGGSRLCPGNDLAKLEISVFLHYFLLGYQLVRLNPECPLRYLPHPRPLDNCVATVIKASKTSI